VPPIWRRSGRPVLRLPPCHEYIKWVDGLRGSLGGRWRRSFHRRCRGGEVTKELQQGGSIVIRTTSGGYFVRPTRGQGEVHG
jgi:hypothetical protein